MDKTDGPFRGEVRLAGHRRVSHGLAVPLREGLDDEEEWRRDLEAYLLVLPETAVFTHLTGARLRGWQLPKLPDQVPVFAAVEGDRPRPRRHGLICSRLVRNTPVIKRHGLPVESAEEILLRCARDLGLLDLIVLIDSALRSGDLAPSRMEKLLLSRRPGVRMLREAWRRSSGLAESGPESLLQQFHVVMEVACVPQVELFDDQGEFIARVDILVSGTLKVHEYDGAHHRDGEQHRKHLRRERNLLSAGYTRRGFVLDDMLNHPARLMHEVDRALARTADLRRLRRWRRLVANSLYSEAGRERVLNRWRRQRGIVDWS